MEYFNKIAAAVLALIASGCIHSNASYQSSMKRENSNTEIVYTAQCLKRGEKKIFLENFLEISDLGEQGNRYHVCSLVQDDFIGSYSGDCDGLLFGDLRDKLITPLRRDEMIEECQEENK